MLDTLVPKGLSGELAARVGAVTVLATFDDQPLAAVAAAGQVRRHWSGHRVTLNA
ncbi:MULTISPECIES: hypothetical protein [unclassified Streptomyces]|uniref:hypothetical protein n=1 Tax=unclassified Streptomyces TaxID=2593676 RepID=UPI00386EE4D0